MNLVSEEPVSLAEVLNILKKKEKQYKEEDKELYYEQKRALDHAKNFNTLGKKDSVSLSKQLVDLDLNLNPGWIAKIVDLVPETVDDVRAIFAKERFKYEEADIKKIIGVVDQFR